MKSEYLYAFYTYAILPQFNIKDASIGWRGSRDIGPNESIHLFSISNDNFILIFEDRYGLGKNPAFVQNAVGLLAYWLIGLLAYWLMIMYI